jgi:5-methylthioadenosine/S-adenosylhomocysteine deaminase
MEPNEGRQPADILFYNASILTMDASLHQYSPGALAVAEGKIVAVGPEREVTQRFWSGQQVDCQGKVLMPGLVNAHTHVPMALLRGLADDMRLDVWLLGYMMPVERQFVSPDFVRLGTALGVAEMIRSGITCFADMYYFEEEVAKTTKAMGMRAVCGQTVLKFPAPDAKYFEESLERTEDFVRRWRDDDLIVPAVAPHAPYSSTEEIFRGAREIALKYDVPLHIHLSETASEVDEMRNEQGMPVIPYVKKQGLLETKVIAAHCVHIDEGEMRTLLHAKAGVAHNPSSNLKLASGVAPVKRMLELGLKVGIGTDGPASNNDLDMFEEMRLASFLAKGSSGDPTALPAETVLLMATRWGAEALHMGDLVGSFEVGKRADLILIDLDSVHSSPRFNREPAAIYGRILYSAKSTDVTDVMVNGRWLLRDKQLLVANEAELLSQAQEIAGEVDTFLVDREKSVYSKLVAIGGAAEEESFEVQAKVPVADPELVLNAIEEGPFEIVRRRHYHEFDTYFIFDDPAQGRLRYREDDFIEQDGSISQVRSRLTLIGSTREQRFPEGVVLSRSRYIAPAEQNLRFYREYFRPNQTVEFEKDRRRFLIRYKDTEFFINLDHTIQPGLGDFLEVKSSTWSRADAEGKVALALELLKLLGLALEGITVEDYFDMAPEKRENA